MNRKEQVLNQIVKQRILPLFYEDDAEVSLNIARTLYLAGIRVLEYTNRGASALENFNKMKSVQPQEMPGLLLGIGTIKTVAEALAFINAGADFIVSPIVDPQVAKVAGENGLLWIPGCMTPPKFIGPKMMALNSLSFFRVM